MAKESEKWFIHPNLIKLYSIITDWKFSLLVLSIVLDFIIVGVQVFLSTDDPGVFLILYFPLAVVIAAILGLILTKTFFILSKPFARIPFCHGILRFYLMLQSNLRIKRVLQYNQLHLLTHFTYDDLKLVVLMLKSNRKYWRYICPYGQNLIKNAISSKYSHDSLKSFLKFYHESLDSLFQHVLRLNNFPGQISTSNLELSDESISRLVYELKPDQHKYLREKLEPNHPVLLELQKQHKIPVQNGLSILK